MPNTPDPAVTPRRLRIFTLRLGLFLMIFGAILLRRHFSYYPVWAGVWLCGLLPCLLFPVWIRPVRRGLLKLSRAAEIVSTFLALGILYFLVLTPLGLAGRLFGKEFLALKLKPRAVSFWIPRQSTTSDPTQSEKQY